MSDSKNRQWAKKGLIIKPNRDLDWMVTHGMLPIPEWRHDDVYRIYYSGRDVNNRSLAGYAEIDLKDPANVLRYSSNPVLGLGELGCFDDNGVTPSWIINHNEKKYLFYSGWNQGSTVRMHLYIGLAISEDGGETFSRYSRAPLLPRIDEEPYLNTAPCVMIDNGYWRMWYVSGVEWVHRDLPRYNIKHAESNDGMHWSGRGTTCIDFESPEEVALARPCVLKEGSTYKMWFSTKGERYRIAYAESNDGISWERSTEGPGIDVSHSGWDSEMIEYSYVFEHKGIKYMLYNGNNYGEGGIGLAVEQGGN